MTSESNLNDRYGRRADAQSSRQGRILIITLASILLGAGAIWMFSTDQLGLGPKVTWTDTGHSLLSSTEVRVDYTIDATPGRQVACAIQAQDKGFTVVGWKVVLLPASEQRMRSFSETLTTIGQATTGLVAQCWLT